MGWKIVALNEVPLGSRTLHSGCKGKDVGELQQLLSTAGFYFGSIDGRYGILTEEAVSLFQNTFGLKNDGIAGPQMLTALKANLSQINRIIYNVKVKENLENISRKFGVSGSAWQGIPGQGNPQRKIYPGMKLLLNQKAVLCSGKRAENFPLTSYLETGWNIIENGDVVRLNPNSGESFQTITAEPDIWKKVFTSHLDWEKIAEALNKETGRYWGIDFRNAPLERIFHWLDFLGYLCRKLQIVQIPFLAIPIPVEEKSLQHRLFWLNLPRLSKFSRILLVEPLSNRDSASVFLKSTNFFIGKIRRLAGLNLGPKTLLMGWAGGWDWNLDQKDQCRRVSYREGRLLAAVNQRTTKYNPDSTFTNVEYSRCNERHCLVFRDQQGWRDWIKVGLKFNLLGFVIRDSKDLGKFGGELITASFGLLPYNKFKELYNS